jgi:hypothetical protein
VGLEPAEIRPPFFVIHQTNLKIRHDLQVNPTDANNFRGDGCIFFHSCRKSVCIYHSFFFSSYQCNNINNNNNNKDDDDDVHHPKRHRPRLPTLPRLPFPTFRISTTGPGNNHSVAPPPSFFGNDRQILSLLSPPLTPSVSIKIDTLTIVQSSSHVKTDQCRGTTDTIVVAVVSTAQHITPHRSNFTIATK